MFSADRFQNALQSERDASQRRLEQAVKDLEAAKATTSNAAPTGETPATTDQERQELQQRVEAIQREKEDFVQVSGMPLHSN
jgi:small-conductance mechanosensitive channel